METYYLYVKTHKITGKKYLGQTKSKTPLKYSGSGKTWITHLKEHGYTFHTEILLCTHDKKELSETGRYFSNLWDVVNSADWLNEIPETGGGPGQSSEFIRNMNLKRVENGTHNWLGGKHQKAVNKNRIEKGTHNWLGGETQRIQQKERLKRGTHHFTNDRYIDKMKTITTNSNRVRKENGTHHLPGKVACCDRSGNIVFMEREAFHEQKASQDFVGVSSKEAKRRIALRHV